MKISRLYCHDANNRSAQPALKLRSFFRGLASADKQRLEATDSAEVVDGSLLYETTKLQQSSVTMRELPPMDKEHARMWVRYWRQRNWVG